MSKGNGREEQEAFQRRVPDAPKILPRAGVVLTEPGEAPKSYKDGPVVIPEAMREKHRLISRVLAVGTGIFDIRPGDMVYCPTYAGMPIVYEGKQYTLIRHEDVLAIVGR